MPKPIGAREASLRGNALRRTLKALRDGDGDATELARRCISLASGLPFAATTRVAQDIHMAEALEELRAGDVDGLARRSPADHTAPKPSSTSDGPLLHPSAEPVVRHADKTSANRGPRRTPREFRTLTSEQVLEVHLALVADFATTPDPIDPPGVKSPDMLESAVARQFTSLGGEPKYKTLAHMAASMFYGLALNHPFHNGNKRTALVSLICLADANDLAVTADQDELYDFVLRVVQHGFRPSKPMPASLAMDLEVEAIGSWIRPRLRRKTHFLRTVRWRDLRASLRRLGVVDELAGGSQIELVRDGQRCVVDFDGDTREVHPGVIRKIRKDLSLTERDGCDDDIFYGDALPLDHFIAKYQGLLRSLANV